MFKSLLETQVQGVMRILGQTDGLAPNQTYTDASGTQSYDYTTRQYSTAETDHLDVPMIFARFKSEEIDDSVVVTTDLKALIAKLDLPVTPSIGDKIKTAAGETYNVERLLGVPGESLYILHVRLTG